ncbi:MAG TPA: lipase family protein [Terriglobales bacterium]|nr:lipase family protein [Terriglobales bacterium]
MWCLTPGHTFPRVSLLAHLNRVSRGTFVTILLLYLTGSSFAYGAAGAGGQATATVKRPEIIRSFRLTKFYDTPDPLPPGKPGELIRSAAFERYDLPLHVSAVRFLYHSRSASGEDVAASGVVLFPDENPPAGGWPVIAWAHGLTGVARGCAPSLAKNLQSGALLSMYVNVGYAVVATDYTGLGTSFRNAFADTLSNAWDVIHSIAAARRAVPQLGSRWIAMGTGEGGMAAVSVAELEHEFRDPSYLGSIAISRLADLQDLYGAVNRLSYNSPLFLAYGIKTVYPQFEIKDMLTEKALLPYQQIGQVCSEPGAAQKASAAAMLKPTWQNSQFVQKYFSRNRLGLRPADAALLVINSEGDPAITETTKIVTRLCQQKDRVQFEKYRESDPGSVIGDSVRDQIAWIQARFANRQAPTNCSAQP